MIKPEYDHLDPRLLTSVLTRLQESYLHYPSHPPSSPLILVYQNQGFTDGIYWIPARLQGPVLAPCTAYRLFCWDIEVESGSEVVMDVLEAQFASSRVGDVGNVTRLEHNPRVREVLHRIRYEKIAQQVLAVDCALTQDYVFPQYALDFLRSVYEI